MRIFQVLEGSTNSAVPGSQTWYRNLYEPLVEMGHEVVLFSAEEGRLAMRRNDGQARAAFSQKLLDTYVKRDHLHMLTASVQRDTFTGCSRAINSHLL